MISSELFALVRCPECHATLVRDGGEVTCSGCARAYRAVGNYYLDMRPLVEFTEQTK